MTYKYTMNFSADGCTYDNMMHVLRTYGVPKTYIEVGLYEGATVFWLADILERFGDYKIYAIDPHEGSVDLDSVDFNKIKETFAHNMNVKKFNIEYMQEYSTPALFKLINSGIKADLIFIDGDHRAAQVLTDIVISWELLNIGGVIICDDSTDWKYTDKNNTSAVQMSPRLAVESFISCNWHKLDIVKLPNSSQTAFRKIA